MLLSARNPFIIVQKAALKAVKEWLDKSTSIASLRSNSWASILLPFGARNPLEIASNPIKKPFSSNNTTRLPISFFLFCFYFYENKPIKPWKSQQIACISNPKQHPNNTFKNAFNYPSNNKRYQKHAILELLRPVPSASWKLSILCFP